MLTFFQIGIPSDIAPCTAPRNAIYLTIKEDYLRIFTEFSNYFEKEISEMKDETIQKEIDLIQQIIESPSNPNFLHETQEPESNTCFIHAMNMYFQT